MDMFEDLMRLTRRLRLAAGEQVQPLNWRPAVDIYQTRRGWLVKVELAGVRSEDIELQVRGRLLMLRGRRYDSELVEEREFYSLEIAYSRFERCLEFPRELDQARVSTDYRQGMLLVRIEEEDTEAPES